MRTIKKNCNNCLFCVNEKCALNVYVEKGTKHCDIWEKREYVWQNFRARSNRRYSNIQG